MTLRTNARLAGFIFLLYIATGLTTLAVSGRAMGGAQGTAAKLASIAKHETLFRLTAVLTLVTFVYAVTLAVTLYALTRDQDRDLAMVAMCCRVSEGIIGALSIVRTLALVSVATASTASATPDAAGSQALGALLLKSGGLFALIGGTCFAVGSTLYAYLFLRARSIPVPLAWLGIFASVLVLVGLPVQMAGFLSGPATFYIWMPMLVFEVTLALWLIVKGVAANPHHLAT